MKLYIKDKKGNLVKTTVYEVLQNTLSHAGLQVKADRFSDKSAAWLVVNQNKGIEEISTHILFDGEDDNIITGVEVWKTPLEPNVDKCVRLT